MAIAESLKADAEAGRLPHQLKLVPGSEYWNVWTEVPLGITDWSHRPLGTMVLSLAYTVDQEGKPAPWNETHWVDKEFLKLLSQANGTLDAEKRREIMVTAREDPAGARPASASPSGSTSGASAIRRSRAPWHIPSKYLHLTEVWIDPKDA